MTGGVLGFVVAAIVIPLLVNEAGDLVRSMPRLRAQFRQDPRRARLPGVLPERTLDAIGQQLTVSAEIDATLHHVADLLVPQFADHCIIDLFQKDALICHVRQHAGGWSPPPGTWKQAGEEIRYPQGHFGQLAMERLDTILVADLANDTGDRYPPPSAESMAIAAQVGLASVLAAPLYARGSLLGVLTRSLSPFWSEACSVLTGRTRPVLRRPVSEGDGIHPAGAHEAIVCQSSTWVPVRGFRRCGASRTQV